MRLSIAIVLVLGSGVGCDHRPPPPQQQGSAPAPSPAAPGEAAPAPSADAGVAPVALADAGAAAATLDALPVVTDDCLAVADRIAQIIIDATTDPTQKAAIAQDRAKLVRRSAETCTQASWPAAARACFMKSKTPAELEACGRELATQ